MLKCQQLLALWNSPFPIAQENSLLLGNRANLYRPLMALAQDVQTIISRIQLLSGVACIGTSAK